MKNRLLWFSLFISAFVLMSYDVDQKKKKVIFFGDSITQAAVQPRGYISQLDSMIKKEGLKNNYELIGSGISANKVYDLYLRLDDDVLAKSPDIVVIYIGVNDVWHKATHGTGTDYDKFGKFYEAIVKKLKAANIQPVLCTPAVIGEKTDNSNQQDGDLNLYSNWIRDFAKRNTLPLVDLRKTFIDYNLQNNKNNQEKGILTTDRVHLNNKGNEVVATEIWKVIKKL
jgi:lysophospholipase L1-like esterase